VAFLGAFPISASELSSHESQDPCKTKAFLRRLDTPCTLDVHSLTM